MQTFRRIAGLAIKVLRVSSDWTSVVRAAVGLSTIASFNGGTLLLKLGLPCTLAVFGILSLLVQPIGLGPLPLSLGSGLPSASILFVDFMLTNAFGLGLRVSSRHGLLLTERLGLQPVFLRLI